MQSRGLEFDIIRDYFTRQTTASSQVVLGIGDDCTLIQPTAGYQQAISVDTSLAGRHFPEDANPYDIGYRALNVSLSDLAAMGAEPRFFTLAISLPDIDPAWLQDFSAGLFQAADNAGVILAGGDTTKGSLAITVQVHGEVETGRALLRSGAQADDYIYVSGTLGDAAAGLKAWMQGDDEPQLLAAYLRPEPALKLGRQLQTLATSCIDISDGLLADLGHIRRASNLGAEIDLATLPLSAALQRYLPETEAVTAALSGGDDYQLCFTSACLPEQMPLDSVTCIGKMTAIQGLQLLNQPQDFVLTTSGFDHFNG